LGLTRDEPATRRRRRGNIDYGEHIDYRDGHTSWPIRIRPRIGRHSYSVNIWRDRFASLILLDWQ
jgi:hypothetical protein